jgi:SAM-dependent methyltransferase
LVSVNSIDLQALRIQKEARARAVCPEVSSLGASGFLAPGEVCQTIALLKPFAINSLLDLGCGNGHLGLFLATGLGSRNYFGVDREESDSPNNRTSGDVCARFIQAQFHELRAALGESIDGAISHDALYLAEDANAVLVQLAEVLPATRPLLFTVYVGEGIFEGGVQGRSLKSWLALLECNGFQVEQITNLTESWRAWGRRFHIERTKLCFELPEPTQAVRRLVSISRRLLGVDGIGMLGRVERYSLLAIRSSSILEAIGRRD